MKLSVGCTLFVGSMKFPKHTNEYNKQWIQQTKYTNEVTSACNVSNDCHCLIIQNEQCRDSWVCLAEILYSAKWWANDLPMSISYTHKCNAPLLKLATWMLDQTILRPNCNQHSLPVCTRFNSAYSISTLLDTSWSKKCQQIVTSSCSMWRSGLSWC